MSRASQLIKEIEGDLARVKKEYIQFLGGITLVEPTDSRDKLTKKVRELLNLTKMKSSEIFRSDNLISKVNAHISLWERQLQAKMGTRRKRRTEEAEKKEEAEKPARKQPTKISISDAQNQRDQVVALYDDYTRTNLSLGVTKQVSFSKFQSFIQQQTQSVQKKKGTREVVYEIVVKDDKAAIKSKSGN